MNKLLLIGALALAGCAHTTPEPVIKTVEVKVPVTVPCVGTEFPGPRPYADTPEALAKAPSIAERYQLLASEYLPKMARLSLLEGVVSACREKGPNQ